MTDIDIATAAPAPIKGMVWAHLRRQNYDSSPVLYTVTSVSTAKNLVYSADRLGLRIKTPLDRFAKFCAGVVEVPAPVVKRISVRMSETEAALLHDRAHAAGLLAGTKIRPLKMVVQDHERPMDDHSRVTKTYVVEGGVCGFAWIHISSARSSYARYLKTIGAWTASEGGVQMMIHAFGQSMERKQAYAAAYLAIIREAGVDCSYSSRMD